VDALGGNDLEHEAVQCRRKGVPYAHSRGQGRREPVRHATLRQGEAPRHDSSQHGRHPPRSGDPRGSCGGLDQGVVRTMSKEQERPRADERPVETADLVDVDGLYRAHVRPLYTFIYGKVGSREAAENLTSEVFTRALAHLTSGSWALLMRPSARFRPHVPGVGAAGRFSPGRTCSFLALIYRMVSTLSRMGSEFLCEWQAFLSATPWTLIGSKPPTFTLRSRILRLRRTSCKPAARFAPSGEPTPSTQRGRRSDHPS